MNYCQEPALSDINKAVIFVIVCIMLGLEESWLCFTLTTSTVKSNSVNKIFIKETAKIGQCNFK